MSYEEHIPVDTFVMNTLTEKVCQQITDSWPIKMEAVIAVVVKHLNELGIYFVEPFQHSKEIRTQIIFILKNSPILYDMIEKARRQAALTATRGRSTADV